MLLKHRCCRCLSGRIIWFDISKKNPCHVRWYTRFSWYMLDSIKENWRLVIYSCLKLADVDWMCFRCVWFNRMYKFFPKTPKFNHKSIIWINQWFREWPIFIAISVATIGKTVKTLVLPISVGYISKTFKWPCTTLGLALTKFTVAPLLLFFTYLLT